MPTTTTRRELQLLDEAPYLISPIFRGGSGVVAAASSVTFGPTSSFTVGSGAVLALVYDNAGTSGADPVSGLTDSNGNTWTVRQSPLNNPGINSGTVMRVWTCESIVSLTNAQTVQVNFGAFTVSAKCWQFWELNPQAGYAARYDSSGSTFGSGANPTITSTSVPAGDVIFGFTGIESNATLVGAQDVDSTRGNWSMPQTSSAGSGTSASNQEMIGQSKVIAAAGTQTYDTTFALNDWAQVWVAFKPLAVRNVVARGDLGVDGTTTAISHGTGTHASSGHGALGFAGYAPVRKAVTRVAVGDVGVAGFAPARKAVVRVGMGDVGVAGFAPARKAVTRVARGDVGLAGFAPDRKGARLTAHGPVALAGFAPARKGVLLVGLGPVGVYGVDTLFSAGTQKNSIGLGLVGLAGYAGTVRTARRVLGLGPVGVDGRATARLPGHRAVALGPVGLDGRATARLAGHRAAALGPVGLDGRAPVRKGARPVTLGLVALDGRASSLVAARTARALGLVAVDGLALPFRGVPVILVGVVLSDEDAPGVVVTEEDGGVVTSSDAAGLRIG